ncbi:zinc-dependent metalloprotease [Cupriavidus nantongensis]
MQQVSTIDIQSKMKTKASTRGPQPAKARQAISRQGVAIALLAAISLTLSACSGGDETPGVAGSASSPGTDGTTKAPKSWASFPKLSQQVGAPGQDAEYQAGDAAIQRLGTSLSAVAAWYGMSPDETKALLKQDRDLYVSKDGRLVYRDHAELDSAPLPASRKLLRSLSLHAEQDDSGVTDAFKLHSRPDSKRKIYLNFVGGPLSFTPDFLVANLTAYDTDGNPSSFSVQEAKEIREIFERVSEDFAPLDVDVTTERPSRDALIRSTADDEEYGVEAFITKDWNNLGTGGQAPLGTFDTIVPASMAFETYEYNHSAFVHYDNLNPSDPADRPAVIADAISHEVGHTLGLHHQSYQGSAAFYEYYPGDGRSSWLPLMSQHPGFIRRVTTWAKGDYLNATNKEDAIAIMQTHGLLLVLDDHGDTFDKASPLVWKTLADGRTEATSQGLVSSSQDRDVFRVEVGDGPLVIRADPADVGPNLNIQLSLYNSAGVLIQTAKGLQLPDDPLSATINISQVAAGSYFVKVEGLGRGSPLALDPNVGLAWGYTNYGSLGRFKLRLEANKPIPAA